MKRPQGYAFTFDPDAETVEEHSITCSHCDKIVFVDKSKPAASAGCGFCPKCELHTCPRCAKSKRCTPLEERLKKMERPRTSKRRRAAA